MENFLTQFYKASLKMWTQGVDFLADFFQQYYNNYFVLCTDG